MKNANIIILQIDKTILKKTPKLIEYFKEYSKYFESFGDKVMIMYHEQTFIDKVDLYLHLDFDYEISLEINTLNNFAKTRLLNNFEENHPELVLVIMTCGKESKLMKIKAKR